MFVLLGDIGQSLHCNRLEDAAAVIVIGRVWILSEGVALVTMFCFLFFFYHPLCSLTCLRLLVLVATNTDSLSDYSGLKVHNGQKDSKGQKGTEDETTVNLRVRGKNRKSPIVGVFFFFHQKHPIMITEGRTCPSITHDALCALQERKSDADAERQC